MVRLAEGNMDDLYALKSQRIVRENERTGFYLEVK
jgi:hypothetical protein